jgi:membrane-bound inhibitor of C-type lysozyme
MATQFRVSSKIGFAGWAIAQFVATAAIAQPPTPTPKIITTAVYQCDDAKGFSAKYFDNQTVQATFGSKVIVLPQTQSASGAKYSNGSVMISTKGDGAIVEVGGTQLFKNCIAVGGQVQGMW